MLALTRRSGLYHSLDVDSNDGQSNLHREPDQARHIILRPEVGAHDISSTMDENHHGEWSLNLDVGNSDVEIERFEARHWRRGGSIDGLLNENALFESA